MKTHIQIALTVLSIFVGSYGAVAQGTAFTYQGSLNSNGVPASGSYDFQFQLYSDPSGATQVGNTVATNGIVAINGQFTTVIDFGTGIFTGGNYWLQIGVRTNNGSNYTTLNPLQMITPTPYAVFANSTSNVSGPLAASQLSGAVPSTGLSGIYGNAVTLNNPSNAFVGSFTGDGSSVTNLSVSNLVGTIQPAQFPSILPPADGSNLTNLSASNLVGTIQPGQFPAALPVANGANLTSLNASQLTMGTTSVGVGGTGQTTTNGIITAFGGSLTQNNPAFFAGSGVGDNPTVATGLPPALFPGQMLVTYSDSTGGQIAGQLFFAGSDFSWRRNLQLGPSTFYADDASGVNGAGFFRVVNANIDNCIGLQNDNPNHYSAMYWNDQFGTQRGAVGYGNTSAPFYGGNNYVEDGGGEKGFLFAARGFVNGGLEPVTGNFVWYAGTNINSATSTVIFRVDDSGNTTAAGDLRADGMSIVTTSGLNGNVMNPATSLNLNSSQSVSAGIFTAAKNLSYAARSLGFDAGGNASGLNFSVASHSVQEIELGIDGIPAMTIATTTDNGGYLSVPCTTFGVNCTNQADNAGFAVVQVNGSFATIITTTTTDYSINETNATILLNGPTLTATLPDATFHCTGRIYTIKLIAASTTGTVATMNSQTIDDSPTYSLSAQHKYVTVQSDGANWQIIANN